MSDRASISRRALVVIREMLDTLEPLTASGVRSALVRNENVHDRIRDIMNVATNATEDDRAASLAHRVREQGEIAKSAKRGAVSKRVPRAVLAVCAKELVTHAQNLDPTLEVSDALLDAARTVIESQASGNRDRKIGLNTAWYSFATLALAGARAGYTPPTEIKEAVRLWSNEQVKRRGLETSRSKRGQSARHKPRRAPLAR